MKYKYEMFKPPLMECCFCGCRHGMNYTIDTPEFGSNGYACTDFRLYGLQLFMVKFPKGIGVMCQECIEKKEIDDPDFAVGLA